MVMRREILEHYLARFDSKGDPSGSAQGRQVGMEAKFCLTDSLGAAVEPERLQELFGYLEERDWTPHIDGNLGIATAAARDLPTGTAAISTGTGHCKIELSVPPCRTLQGLQADFDTMAEEVKSFADARDIHLLCLGVHPVTEPHPGLVQMKTRHTFWDRVFQSGLVHLFTVSADCQVHVDVGPEEVHKAVNVLQGFTGAQIALTANATVWKGDIDRDHLDVREAFWDWWLPWEDRAGVASCPFGSLEDYVDRLAAMRPVFVERGGRSLGIYHYRDFKEYYLGDGEAHGVTVDGERVPLVPEERDIDLHDTFNWYTARLSRYCTVENRANCQQPPSDIMTIPALTLGLVENLDKALEVLAGYDWDTLRRSRSGAVRAGPWAVEGGLTVTELCRPMLDLAREGLVERGEGEEGFLAPLVDRLERRACPALETRRLFEESGVESLVERYSL